MNERLLPPREVYKRLGVHYMTVKRWIYSGRIRAVKTPTGRWLIPESEVARILGGAGAGGTRAVIYARVRSSDQRGDLERQVEYLRQYCAARGYSVVDVLSDVASGLRTDRRGLMKLLDHVTKGEADAVVVTHRDRLTRFGFEYLERLFSSFGARMEVVFGGEPKDSREELVDDMMELIASFAGRLYGTRSHRRKELVEGFKELVEEVERGGEGD